MVSTVGLFLAGGYFGYRMVYPGALDFLIRFSGQFQPMITVGEYTDLFLTIIAGLGVVFEMPILIFFLALMGIVSAGWMWRNFRYAILAIFIISGIISPDAGYHEHVHLRRAHDRALFAQHRRLPGSCTRPNARSALRRPQDTSPPSPPPCAPGRSRISSTLHRHLSIFVWSQSMSSVPLITSPDPMHQAFPKLTPAQLERIRPYGKLRAVTAGEVLFEAGDSDVPVFVILSGSMNILQPCLSEFQLLVTHRAGGFSGEYIMISGQHAMVRGAVGESGEFIEVPIENFRAMIARDAELSELFMRVFILRRLELIHHEAGNAILLGSNHSPATLRSAGISEPQRPSLSLHGSRYR